MIKVVKVVMWFILLMVVLNTGFNMLNAQVTMVNIIGVLLILAYVALSIETRCFTIKFKKEKDGK